MLCLYTSWEHQATRGGAADRDRGSPGYIEGHLPSRDPNRPARPLPLQPVLPAANLHTHPVRGDSASTETHPGSGAPGTGKSHLVESLGQYVCLVSAPRVIQSGYKLFSPQRTSMQDIMQTLRITIKLESPKVTG